MQMSAETFFNLMVQIAIYKNVQQLIDHLSYFRIVIQAFKSIW